MYLWIGVLGVIMRKLGLAIAGLLLSAGTASADFERWSAEIENDPFSNGMRVTVGYMSSMRSGILIICDTKEPGMLIRAIPGFAYESSLALVTPEIQIAVDGNIMTAGDGETGSVGDNLAVSQVTLNKETALQFVDLFTAAKKQVAIKDGISDRPFLLSARGSTKASEALKRCIAGQ